MLNLNTQVKNILGESMKKSFPRTDADKAENETFGNMILNSLAGYPVKDKRDVFIVYGIAQRILTLLRTATPGVEAELLGVNPEDKRIITDALLESVFRKENDVQAGVYPSWMIAQVLEDPALKA